MIQLVVFDIAGTTVHDDNNVHQALQSALASHGVATSIEEINPFMGIPKPYAIETLLKRHIEDHSLISNEMVNKIHEVFLEKMIDFYQNNATVRQKSNAEFVFKALREKGIKIALDTGFSRDITDVIIQRLGWQDLIDTSVASNEVAKGRPAPDMIFKAMELLHITNIKNVVKVGDTEVDIQQGKRAGCQYVIGVTTGAYSKADLEKENPTHLIEDLKEILSIIL